MKLGNEQIDHINIVNWFNFNFPELEQDLHHFANERKCSVQQGRLLKRMGVKRGVYDFFIAIPMNGKAGLWIELKTEKGKPSKEQIAFGQRKIKKGYAAFIVYGYDNAIAVITNYLGIITK